VLYCTVTTNFPITTSQYDTTSSEVHTSLASINDTINHSLTYLITRGERATFCLDGVIDISLSSTPVNFLPSALSIVIPMLLEPPFFIVVQKFDVTLILAVLRNESEDFTDVLENDVVGLTVVTVGVITGLGVVVACHRADGLIVVASTTGFSGTGGRATRGFLVFCIILLLITVLEEVRVGLGMRPFDSINAIGSTVLAKSDSLHNPFSTIS
jgi:hypothetical protein